MPVVQLEGPVSDKGRLIEISVPHVLLQESQVGKLGDIDETVIVSVDDIKKPLQSLQSSALFNKLIGCWNVLYIVRLFFDLLGDFFVGIIGLKLGRAGRGSKHSGTDKSKHSGVVVCLNYKFASETLLL